MEAEEDVGSGGNLHQSNMQHVEADDGSLIGKDIESSTNTQLDAANGSTKSKPPRSELWQLLKLAAPACVNSSSWLLLGVTDMVCFGAILVAVMAVELTTVSLSMCVRCCHARCLLGI